MEIALPALPVCFQAASEHLLQDESLNGQIVVESLPSNRNNNLSMLDKIKHLNNKKRVSPAMVTKELLKVQIPR